MGTLDQAIPAVGPQTAVQWADEINTELAELFRRSLAVVGSPAGTNNYTGSIPLGRTLEDGNGLLFRVPNSNTGPCDLNGISIVTPTGAALQTGQLLAGMEIVLIRNQASNTYRVHTPLTGGTAPIMRVYATPGTFTWNRPTGLRAIKVRVQAGGGGASNTSQAGGAGAGGYGERIIQASLLPATVTITVGAGGAAGATGNPGGSSSFGAFVTTLGGNGGFANIGNAPGGGVGTGGDINLPGQAGGVGMTGTMSGYGGSSPFGGTGGKSSTGGVVGSPGVFGGGGSAPNSTTGGGAGGNGIVTVEEIY